MWWAGPGRASRSLVQVGPVVGSLDVDPPDPLDPLPLSLLIFVGVVGTPGCSARGFQQCVVGSSAVLGFIEQNIQCLLVDPGFGELNLRESGPRASHACGRRATTLARPPRPHLVPP